MDTKKAELFADVTIQDIAENPKKYGAPTFAEFLKNRKKYQQHNSEAGRLAMMDNGPKQTRGQIRKTIYVINGVKCESPERAEVVAKEENIDLRYYQPQLIDIGGQKADLHLIFNTRKQHNGSKEGASSLILPP